MNIALRLLGLACLVFVFTSAGEAQNQFNLTYKFPRGKTLLYRNVVKNDMTQEMAGQEMKVTNDIIIKARLTVDQAAENGDAVLVISADSVVAHTKSPMRDTTMSLTDVTGKRTRVTISSIGVVVKREVLDSIRSTMGRMGSREMMRFHQFSGKPVRVGDKWMSNVIDSTEMGGGHVRNAMDMEYTLAGREKKAGCDCVRINYTGKVTTAGKGSMMGMDFFIEGSGTMAGSFYFDDSRGLMVLDDATVDNEMTMAATGQQNMTIPISQSTHYTNTLVR